MNKKRATMILATFAGMLMATASYAGQWEDDEAGWWYSYGNGSYPVNIWEWIDGDKDGVSECYYFDEQGYMLADTTTPDGYQVNESGAWIVDGKIQTQRTEAAGSFAVSADRMAGHDTFASYPESEIRTRSKNEIIDHGDYYEFTECVIYNHLEIPEEIRDEIRVGYEFTLTLEGVDGKSYFATFRTKKNPLNHSSYQLECLENNMDLYIADYYYYPEFNGFMDGWGDSVLCPIYTGSLYFSKNGNVSSVKNFYTNEITVPFLTFEEYITQDQGADPMNSTYRWGNHNGEVSLYGYPVFDSNTGLIIEFQEWPML